MGLFKGNATISRYRVRDKLPASFAEEMDKRIRHFAFIPIEEGTEELSVGWVSASDYMDTGFAYASYALDPYTILGLRIDRRRVSGSLIKKYHRLEMEKAKRMREGKVLSRSEKEDLKEKAKLDVLTRIPPQTQSLDVCWDTSSGQVWLGSATASVRELFEDLFKRTFELTLEPVLPWLLAKRLVDKGPLASRLEAAGPLSLYSAQD